MITQINTEPAIYFDHWALRLFSSDRELRRRFYSAVVHCNGMLEISWMNLLDFSGVSDSTQINDAEEFLDMLSPKYIGFINVDTETVIKFENRFLSNERDVKDPHVDYELLRKFALYSRKSLNICSFNGFFPSVYEQRKKLNDIRLHFLRNISENLPNLREKAQNPEILKRIKKITKGHKDVQYLTRYIDVEIAKYILRNNVRMESNDWCDVHHVVVPMAYCDFVLLDQRWNTISRQVQSRLRKVGHDKKMAEVFSQRSLEDFLKRLEAIKGK